MAELNLRDFSALALDYDGVLIDGDLHLPSRRTAYDRFALETGDDRFSSIEEWIHLKAHQHATTPEGINAWVLAKAGIINNPLDTENPIVLSVVSLKREVYTENIASGPQEIPGSSSFIKKASVRLPGMLGIVTMAHESEVDPYLKRYKLGRYIPRQRIVAFEDLKDKSHTKPHPEAYELFMDRFSISDPSSTLVVEDSPQGIEAAKQAGATVIAIASSRDINELNKLHDAQQPDKTIKDFRELSLLFGMSPN